MESESQTAVQRIEEELPVPHTEPVPTSEEHQESERRPAEEPQKMEEEEQVHEETRPAEVETDKTEEAQQEKTEEEKPIKQEKVEPQQEEVQKDEDMMPIESEEKKEDGEKPAEGTTEAVEEDIAGNGRFADLIREAKKLYDTLFPVEMWDLDGEKDGIKAYSRLDTTTGLKMARGDGIINRPIDVVVQAILGPKMMLKWEGNLVQHDILEDTDGYQVIRSLDMKRMLVAQRETLLVVKTIKREDGSVVILQKSVDHPDFPEQKEFVRAGVNLCAWTLAPVGEGKIQGSYIIGVDPKGWVPKAVFNAFVADHAQNIKKVKTYVEKL